ncbi:MAG TPA: LuxR C-terminal-related transcriptional regulator, partial [Caldilineaceae bacterium]|nr:LuxR C-terminal-related transcriptional regulator [Caldilineaceae bacterium]
HGDHHYVFDYLMEEVLARQPADMRFFLLQTAILNRLRAPLCVALTAMDRSHAILEALAHMNLFLIPLDDQRHWYRYHNLFSDFLRQQLAREVGPNEIKRLHQRAGAWYKVEGLLHEAMYHFLRAEDFVAAAWLIEQNRLDLLMRGEWQCLSTWLERFSPALQRSRLGLMLADSWCRLFAADLETVAERIQEIEAMVKNQPEFTTELDSSDAVGLRGELAAIRSKLYLWQNDHQRAIEAAQQALTHLTNGNQFLRAHVTLDLGYGYRAQDDFDAAHAAFSEAGRLYQAMDRNSYIPQIVLNSQADLYHKQGQLPRAIEVHQTAIQLATRGQEHPSLLAGLAYLGLGRVHYEWNELDLAEQQFMTALDLNRRLGLHTVLSTNLIALAYVDQVQQKPAAAQQKMAEALQCVQEADPHIQAITAAHQARLWLRQDNLSAAISWADANDLPFDGDLNEFNIIPYLSLIRVRIAQGQTQQNAGLLQEIADLLDRWLSQTDSTNRRRRTIELSILCAVCLTVQHNLEPTAELRQTSLAHLTQALFLAKAGGYIRLFVDEGEPMAALLHQWDGADTLTDYRIRLLAAFPQSQLVPQRRTAETIAPQNDLLSEREVEIMHLVADGLTAPQMAEKLIISIHTMRTHLKNIYRKLEVHSRVQAVEKVRTLGVL